MGKQAWAQNAVIIEDDGKMCVRYRPRCPKCGYIPTYLNMAGTAQENVRSNTSGHCDKCGEYFSIVISRG